MGVPGLLKVLKNQGLLQLKRRHPVCDHLYIDVAQEIHMIMGRHGDDPKQLKKHLGQRLHRLIKLHRPRKSLCFAFDGPAPLSKAALQQKRRLKDALSKRVNHSMAATPGCKAMDAMHSAARVQGDAWLRRVPHGELTLSSSNVPGEGEVKVFSALRVRFRAALHRQSQAQARSQGLARPQGGGAKAGEAERHVVVCGDSDTVVMALMLDPRANVTIDFGPRHGVLDTALLRQRWLLQPLLQAGLQLGPDPHVISGFTQDLALLTVMQSGNDYLPCVPLRVAHGPNATSTYLRMRATGKWRHRTLLVVDRQRRAAGLDVEFLLHVLLDIYSRMTKKRARAAAMASDEDSGEEWQPASQEAHAPALEAALAAVAAEAAFPGLQHMDGAVWRKWQGMIAELPAAVQEALPEQLQIEELVNAATEPRVVAVGADMLAAGGQGLRDSCEGHAAPLPRAAALREALALFKSPTQPATAGYFAGLRWCAEMYCFSTCRNFRLATGAKNSNDRNIAHNDSLCKIISFLALGWARHVAQECASDSADPKDPEIVRNSRAAQAVLERCDAWRLSAAELRAGGLLWPRGTPGAKPPYYIGAMHEQHAMCVVSANLAVDSCVPADDQGDPPRQASSCVVQQCGASSAVQRPDDRGLALETVPCLAQCIPAGPEPEGMDSERGGGEGGRRGAAPVLLLVPTYGNESGVDGEWVGLHDVSHGGVWREGAQGACERCAWSQTSPMLFCNAQADDHAHAMHAAAHARTHRASVDPTVDPAAAVAPTEAQRRVLECASLSYGHPEVAVPAALRALQRLPLDADRRAEQLQGVWGGLPPYKELVRNLTGVALPQGAELRGENAARIAAQRLTAHFSLLEDEFRRDEAGGAPVELPAALRQPPPVLPTELRRALSESSALSPAGHGVHVTPRAGLHLLADETAAATATMLDTLKPECPQCDELRRQQKTAATVLHAATVHVADIQGSWRLLDALAGSTGRLLADVFVEASSGTRSKRNPVSVTQLFHQGAVSAVGQEGGGAEEACKSLRSAMHDYASTPGTPKTRTATSSRASAWTRLPGCSMHASFVASDALQDLHVPETTTGDAPRGMHATRSRASEDGSASGWCRFGYWQGSRYVVMGGGGRASAGGARMHHVEVAQQLLLGAWTRCEQSTLDSPSASVKLHKVAKSIGLPSDTAHAVLAALADVRAVHKSRGSHARSLRVLAVAFSLGFALRGRAAAELSQAQEDLEEARVFTHATDSAAATHRNLSHGMHGSQGVAALTDHLAASSLSGRTAACSLALLRWNADHDAAEKPVAQEGQGGGAMRLVKGGAAFSAASPSGQVALAPTVVRRGASFAQHSVEECSVIDEQARALKPMYLRDAAARRARAKRSRRSTQEGGAVAGVTAAPRMDLWGGVGRRSRTGSHMSWSSARVFRSFRESGPSSRCQSMHAWLSGSEPPSAMGQAACYRPCQQVGRQARIGVALRCRKAAKAVAIR